MDILYNRPGPNQSGALGKILGGAPLASPAYIYSQETE